LKPLDLGGPRLRLLVVSPHPDDEVLAAGGTIARAAAEASVHVVFLTSGDGFGCGVRLSQRVLCPRPENFLSYGRERMEEARRALGVLGLSEEDITFLGYPDGGLEGIWTGSRAYPYTSPFSHCSTVPYEDALSPGAPYVAESIICDLAKVMELFRPTVILLPHPRDTHPDHRFCALFTLTAAAQERRGEPRIPQLFAYLIHAGIWQVAPVLWKKKALRPPRRFLKRNCTWYTLTVERCYLNLKRQAILQYRTQLEIVAVFMKNFLRPNEILSGIDISLLDRLSPVWRPHGSEVLSVIPPAAVELQR